MIKAVLFDLDDTLYEEVQFFRGGFAAAAEWLANRGFSPPEETAALLTHFHLHEGRSDVLQKLARRLGFSSDWIPELAQVVRNHSPQLVLSADVRDVLLRLRRKFKLGCITDGWSAVQRAKIAALGVAPLLDEIVIADDLGRAHWKPHPLPFQKCCAALGVAPAEAVFVGDNLERDGAGAANAGLKFVRLRRPGAYFASQEPSEGHRVPDAEIQSLAELEATIETLSDCRPCST